MGDVSPHFSRDEFRCKDGTPAPVVDCGLLCMLEAIRARFLAPITITSGFRTVAWNRKVGGAANSMHLYGKAADIKVEGVSPQEVYAWADGYFRAGGLGLYRSWVHVDSRPVRARWGATRKT